MVSTIGFPALAGKIVGRRLLGGLSAWALTVSALGGMGGAVGAAVMADNAEAAPRPTPQAQLLEPNGAVNLVEWDGAPIGSTSSHANNPGTISGLVQQYLEGERAGNDSDKPVVGSVNVYGRYQDNDGAWSPVFYTTSLSEPKSEGLRSVNYRLLFKPFRDYAGKLHRFSPGSDKKSHRIQIWIDKSANYRLAFSERSGGVVHGYSKPLDFNYFYNGGNQIMQWDWKPDTVQQLNIGVIRVATKDWIANSTIKPSQDSNRSAAEIGGQVRWEYRTLDRTSPTQFGANPNLSYPETNKGAKDFVVVARVETGSSSSGYEYYWTRTDENGFWKIKAPGMVTESGGGLLTGQMGKNISVQIFDPNTVGTVGTELDKNKLVALPPDMGYWGPFPKGLEPHQYASGPSFTGKTRGEVNYNFQSGFDKAKKMVFTVRPTDMRVAVGTGAYDSRTERYDHPFNDMGNQAAPGQEIKVYVAGMPVAPDKKLRARLYKGYLYDEHKGSKPEWVADADITLRESNNAQGLHGGEGEGVFKGLNLNDEEDTQYWVDIVDLAITANPSRHVLASYSFKYSPVFLDVYPNATQGNKNGKPVVGEAFKSIGESGNPAFVGDQTTGGKLLTSATQPTSNNPALLEPLPNTSNGIKFAPDTRALGGAVNYSGLLTFRIKGNVQAAAGNRVISGQTYVVRYRVKPAIKPQMGGAVAKDNESNLPRQAKIGQKYDYFISASAEADGSLAQRIVKKSGQTITAKDGLYDLGNGLKLDERTLEVFGTPQTDTKVEFTLALKNAYGTSEPQTFVIDPGTPISLQDANVPTLVAGGEPVYIRARGGSPENPNSYDPVKGFAYKDAQWDATVRGNIGGVGPTAGTGTDQALVEHARRDLGLGLETETLGNGKVLKIDPKGAKNTTLQRVELPVVITDQDGRTLDGKRTKQATVSTKKALDGTEGWVRFTLLPQAKVKELPAGTLRQEYGPVDVKQYLKLDSAGVSPNTPGAYTYTISGLPAGMYATPDGIIKGSPNVATGPEGADITLTMVGKDDGPMAGVTQQITTKLRVGSNFGLKPDPDNPNRKPTQVFPFTVYSGTEYGKNKNLPTIPSLLQGFTGPLKYSVDTTDEFHKAADYHDADVDHFPWREQADADKHKLGHGLEIRPADGQIVGIPPLGTQDAYSFFRITVYDSDTATCGPEGCKTVLYLALRRIDNRHPEVESDSRSVEVSQYVTPGKPLAFWQNIWVIDGSGDYTEIAVEAKKLPEGVKMLEHPNGRAVEKVAFDNFHLSRQKYGDKTVSLLTVHFELSQIGPKTFDDSSGILEITARDRNGSNATGKIELTMRDTRPLLAVTDIVTISGLEEGKALSDGSGGQAAPAVTGIVAADSPVRVKCFIPAGTAASACSGGLIDLKGHGLPGLKLDPATGQLSGTPAQGSAGTHQLNVVAVAQNGNTASKTVNITINPTNLHFEPGFAAPGTAGADQPYMWEFDAATGGPEPKRYQLLDKDGKPIPDCQVGAVSQADKAKVTCPNSGYLQTAAGKGPVTLRVIAGTGAGALQQDVEVSVDFRTPVTLVPIKLPATATGQQYVFTEQNSVVALRGRGGNGQYVFSLPGAQTGSGECADGYPLSTTKNESSGLCLHTDGTITGTAANTGTVDLSGVQLQDTAGRVGTTDGIDQENLNIVISEPVVLTSNYPGPANSTDTNAILRPEKHQAATQVIATYAGGSGANNVTLVGVNGLDQFGVADGKPTVSASLQGKKVVLSGTWTKINSQVNAVQIVVKDSATGQTTATEAYIQVLTDLKFTTEPKGETMPDGSKVAISAAEGKVQPESIPDEAWGKVSGQVEAGKPTLGISITEEQLNDPSKPEVTIPRLTEGGAEPITYRTEPCDKTDEQGNCAIGGTGLFLDKNTGKIIGKPQPGQAAVVVIVADSDNPPQRKEANLVIAVADNRVPEVVAGQTFTVDKSDFYKKVPIAITGGSGSYSKCELAGTDPTDTWVTGWIRADKVSLENGTCSLHLTPVAADAPHDQSFTVKIMVTDQNGKTNRKDGSVPQDQWVTVTVKDTRKPYPPTDTPLGAGGEAALTATEGEPFEKSWTGLKVPVEDHNRLKITQWTVEGLPPGFTFDPGEGKISGTPSTDSVGEYTVVFTATGENGQITARRQTLKVNPANIDLVLPAFPKAQYDKPYPATVGGAAADPLQLGKKGCADCTFSIVYVKDTNGDKLAHYQTRVDAGSGVITFPKWPASGQDAVTVRFRLSNTDGSVWREKSAVIAADNTIRVSNLIMSPVYKNQAAPHCVRVVGGTAPYTITVSGATGHSEAQNSNRVCFTIPENTLSTTGVQTLNATVTDSANPQGSATVNLQLQVKGGITLQDQDLSQPGTLKKKKSQISVDMTTGMSDDTCFMGSNDTDCNRRDVETRWELVGAPAGLSISDTGVISGSVDHIYDGSFIVKVTKSLDGDTAVGSAEVKLKVVTNLTPPSAGNLGSVEIQTDGSGKVTPPAGGSADPAGKQLLPDLGGKGTYVVDTGGAGAANLGAPNAEGNWPIRVGGKDTGLALTPTGQLVGTLTPGVLTGNQQISVPVKVQDAEGGDPTETSTLTFTLTDERKPKALNTTDNVINVEMGIAQAGQFPFVGGSGAKKTPAYTIDNPGSQTCPLALSTDASKWEFKDTWQANPAITSPTGKTYTCQVTLHDFNGQDAAGRVQVVVKDLRRPLFANGTATRSTWQGHLIPPFPVVVNYGDPDRANSPAWVVQGDNTHAVQLAQVSIDKLPDGLKLYRDAAAQNPITPGHDDSYTCDLSGSGGCYLSGVPSQDAKGGHDLVITATGVNGQQTRRNARIEVFGPALGIRDKDGVNPTGTAGKALKVTVAQAGYTKPADMTQAQWDKLKHPASCNLARSYALGPLDVTTGPTGAFKNDTPGRVEIAVRPGSGDATTLGLTGALEDSADLMLPADPSGTSGCAGLGLKWQNIVLSAAAGNVKAGSYPITVTLTDGRGMVGKIDTTITIMEDLSFTNAPFNAAADPVTLVRGVAGHNYLATDGGRYRAVVSGGDRNYQSVALDKSVAANQLDAAQLDVKAWGKAKAAGTPPPAYQGIEPIFCTAQPDKGAKDRPKCLPLPGLAPTAASISGNATDNRYNGEGLFLLTDGTIVGSIPASTAPGDYQFRLAVRDGGGRVLSKLVTITVVQPVEIAAGSITNNVPSGMKGAPYGTNDQNAVPRSSTPVELFKIVGGAGQASSAGGNSDYSGYQCKLTPALAGMTCTVAEDGSATLNGTPTAAFEGTITATVSEPAAAGSTPLSVSHSFPFTVEGNMQFQEVTDGAAGSITVTPPATPLATPLDLVHVKITAPATGKAVEPNQALQLGVNEAVSDGTFGTDTGLKYWLEDGHGNRAAVGACPANAPQHPRDKFGKELTGQTIVCYPLGDTGLFLTSAGQVVGTAQPGKSANSVVVVADNDSPPRTKKANLDVAIEDRRPGTISDLQIDVSVGDTLGGGSSAPQVPFAAATGLDTTEAGRVAAKLGVTTNLGQIVTQRPQNRSGEFIAPDCVAQNDGPDGPANNTLPNWLTVSASGTLSGTVGANHNNGPLAKYQACVWYVGANGVAVGPAKVTVTVRDQRSFTPDPAPAQPISGKQGVGVGQAGGLPANITLGSADSSLTSGMKIEVLNPATGTWSSPTENMQDTTSVPGVTITGPHCSSNSGGNSGGCQLQLSGAPTQAAAGTHAVQYRLTLNNGQHTVVSIPIHIEPFQMDLTVPTVMAVAIEGSQYLEPEAIEATSDATNLGFKVSGLPNGLQLQADRDTARTGPAGSAGSRAMQVVRGTPGEGSAEGSAKTYTVTVTAYDKDKCETTTASGGTGAGAPGTSGSAKVALESCEYKETKTLQITVIKKPGEKPLQVSVPQGGTGSSGPIFDATPLPSADQRDNPLAATTQEILRVEVPSPEIHPDTAQKAITLVGNKLNVTAGALPAGKYTVTVKTTLPGGIVVTRKVEITITKPAPTPAPAPSEASDTPGTTNPSGGGVSLPEAGSKTGVGKRLGKEKIVRHAGKDRAETALAVLDYFSKVSSAPAGRLQRAAYPEYAQKMVQPWSDTAVLVREDDFSDALVAGVLADELNAPVLVSHPRRIQPVVVNALRRHEFTRVVMVGKEKALSVQIQKDLQQNGFTVERLGGDNRYQTAVAVAGRVLQERGTSASQVLVANGTNFPDALTATSAAIKNKAVVLLTNNNQIIRQTKDWMTSGKTQGVTAVGGPAKKAATHSAGVKVDRALVGKDRYETAKLVANTMFPPAPGRVAIATGTDFPDVSVGVTITARTGAPMLLTKPNKLAGASKRYLEKNAASIDQVDILGGSKAVSQGTRDQIAISIGETPGASGAADTGNVAGKGGDGGQ